MKVYSKCPDKKNEAAMRAWMHFVAKHDELPLVMYKRPNCFRKASDRSVLTGWGLWVAHYNDYIDYWDPADAGKEFRNLYDFISKQGKLTDSAPKGANRRG